MGIACSSACVVATTPTGYSNFAGCVEKRAAAGACAAKAQCASALQKAGFATIGANANNYQPALAGASAANTAAQGVNILGAGACYLKSGTAVSGLCQANKYLPSATACLGAETGAYLNPYTKDVVCSIGQLGQQNIQQNLAPGATAGAVGSGQFGSQRGAQVLGQTLRCANNAITAQQNSALQAGYASALCAAKAQNTEAGNAANTAATAQAQANANQVAAGNTAISGATACAAKYATGATTGLNLACSTQGLGLKCANAALTAGAICRCIQKCKSCFGLTTAAKEAGAGAGLVVPQSTKTTMQASPLSTAATLGSLGAGALKAFPSLCKAIQSGLSGLIGGASSTGTNGATTNLGCSAGSNSSAAGLYGTGAPATFNGAGNTTVDNSTPAGLSGLSAAVPNTNFSAADPYSASQVAANGNSCNGNSCTIGYCWLNG